MDKGRSVDNQAGAILRRALERAGGGRLHVDERPGHRVAVGYHGALSILLPVWAGEGFPEDVRGALRRLREMEVGPGETPVIVAKELSPGARTMLAERAVAWLDAAGRGQITAAPGLAILLDSAPPVGEVKPQGTRWTEASGAIAELVLEHARVTGVGASAELPAVVEIAKRLKVSATVVSRALRAFEDEGWTEKVGPERGPRSRRRLVTPGELLSAWAAWHRSGRAPTVDAHKLIRNLEVFVEEELANAWADEWWALTGAAAAERRAPFFTSIPVADVYLRGAVLDDDNALDVLLRRAGLARVDSGARVRIHAADRYLPRLVATSGVRLVGDIRLYGDLLRSGGRGVDAAEHLRETRIGF